MSLISTPHVIPAKIEQVAMSPGHGCELPGAVRTCSMTPGREVSAGLPETPAFAGVTACAIGTPS
jgi:hypothetical protein